MSNQIIFFDGEVTSESVNELKEQIEILNPSEEITVYITSNGGNPNWLKSLERYIAEKNLNITTVAMDKVASAAVTLFMLGNKRCVMQNSVLLLHEPRVPCINSNMTLSSAQSIINELNDVEYVTFKNIYSKSNITKETLKEKISNEKIWEINSSEALKLGLATCIM